MIYKKEKIKNSIVISDGDINISYFNFYGSKIIRNVANVNGYIFYKDYQDGNWKKKGRGNIKNKEKIKGILKEVDSFLIGEGYYFN